MPQSWPSQWVLLFMFFIMIFCCVVALNFFNASLVSEEVSQAQSQKVCSSLNWSW